MDDPGHPALGHDAVRAFAGQVELERLTPEHLRALDAYRQAAQVVSDDPSEAMKRLCRSTPGAAAILDGQVLAAAGVVEIWPGRGMAWFLAGTIRRRHWPVITAMVRAGLLQAQRQGVYRIECSVAEGHAAGHRWAQKLGFRPECYARKYLPHGRNAFVYVMVA